MIKRYGSLAGFVLLLVACKGKEASTDEAVAAEEVRTPVTVTSVVIKELTDVIELNATSAFQQTNVIKSSANGYLKAVAVKLGQMVRAGQLAFTIQTKEARALGNTINSLDPSFRFSGMIPVKAAVSGYLQSLDHQPGDYVQDGEQLAVVADLKSFGFILNLPVELRQYVNPGLNVQIDLPDGTHLAGRVSNILPNVDSVSQTQQVLIKVPVSTMLPQNLIAKVRVVKARRSDAVTLPKAAVLTDEAQSSFWVMKLIDSVTAVKVPVIKGMETVDGVEIIQPRFSAVDKIILTGNYGLSDTAKIKIVKAAQ